MTEEYFNADEDEEEVMDVRPSVVEKCKAKAENAKLFTEYMKCSERIAKKGHGECTGQYFDFWKSMDKCVREVLLLFVFSVCFVARNRNRADADFFFLSSFFLPFFFCSTRLKSHTPTDCT